MIRIQTTAEFDAEGRFTGRIMEPVPPGVHPIDVMIEEQETLLKPTDPPSSDFGLRKEGNVWVLDCTYSEDPEDVRRRLDEESMRQMLEGPWE